MMIWIVEDNHSWAAMVYAWLISPALSATTSSSSFFFLCFWWILNPANVTDPSNAVPPIMASERAPGETPFYTQLSSSFASNPSLQTHIFLIVPSSYSPTHLAFYLHIHSFMVLSNLPVEIWSFEQTGIHSFCLFTHIELF